MVAARDAVSMINIRYSWEEFVNSIDWQRVYIQAKGEHLLIGHTDGDACGECISRVLLRRDE